MKITAQWLVTRGACVPQREIFSQQWPTGAAYTRATQSAWEACDRATQEILEAYDRATKETREEYKRVIREALIRLLAALNES